MLDPQRNLILTNAPIILKRPNFKPQTFHPKLIVMTTIRIIAIIMMRTLTKALPLCQLLVLLLLL